MEAENLNVFYRCDNCHFSNKKRILSFSSAVGEIALEWGVPYEEYSKIFQQMSVDGLSQYFNWQAAI